MGVPFGASSYKIHKDVKNIDNMLKTKAEHQYFTKFVTIRCMTMAVLGLFGCLSRQEAQLEKTCKGKV